MPPVTEAPNPQREDDVVTCVYLLLLLLLLLRRRRISLRQGSGSWCARLLSRYMRAAFLSAASQGPESKRHVYTGAAEPVNILVRGFQICQGLFLRNLSFRWLSFSVEITCAVQPANFEIVSGIKSALPSKCVLFFSQAASCIREKNVWILRASFIYADQERDTHEVWQQRVFNVGIRQSNLQN